ncbi:MAG: outer membrane beta-barrel protein [Gammaproteobacteria bacterium]|nr:outer membrane beta-barrel protein [Gammaproteobacteria bacterium]
MSTLPPPFRFPALAILFGLACATPSLLAYEAGDWVVRAGSITIDPTSSTSPVAGGAFELHAGSDTQLGLSVTYMLFNQLGIEVQAATPFSHDVSARGAGKIASVKHLPPTLTANYYPFGGRGQAVQPFIGTGINHTVFWSETLTALGAGATGASKLSAGSSWGLAAQAGVDYRLNDRLGVGLSVYYIDIESQLKLDGNRIGKIKIDPWIYRFQLSYRL